MHPKLFESINAGKLKVPGERGLPEYYPCPPYSENLLFYIQRNQNTNTVVYELNRLLDGRINPEFPINVFWLRFSEDCKVQELNYIQNKLAYGYESTQINDVAFEFELVSYRRLKFYIGKDKDGRFKAYTKINGVMAIITNFYVFVEDFGLFPDVKYIELYGEDMDHSTYLYEKINI